MYDEERLNALLRQRGATSAVNTFASATSTNDQARAAAATGASHGSVFLADAQTAGRGRGAHRWHSPPGQNLYLSLLLRPKKRRADMSALTLAIGVTVARVADQALAEPRAMIKWPNDIYVDDLKLGGILVESTLQGDRLPVLVVGIGLNVLIDTFPDDLTKRATSLRLAGAELLDRHSLAADLIAAVLSESRQFFLHGLGPTLSELRRRDWLRGRQVAVGDATGTAGGIDDAGRLLVDGRPQTSGEVALR